MCVKLGLILLFLCVRNSHQLSVIETIGDAVSEIGVAVESASEAVSDIASFAVDELLKTLKGINSPKKQTNFSESEIQSYKQSLDSEDVNLNVSQLLTKYGYPVEEHEVQTSDGYLLTLIRIPGDGPSALLVHGFISSADDWVVAGPDVALPYLLADKGYDIWLANTRGSKHSRKHITLSPDNDKAVFFNHSWHEVGIYDMPATIDHILETAGKKELVYIGHSQGRNIFYVLCSELPEYNVKISYYIGLAPPSFIKTSKSPFIRYLAPFSYDDDAILSKLLGPEFLPEGTVKTAVKELVCGVEIKNVLGEVLCANFLFLLYGWDNSQLKLDRLGTIIAT